MSQNKSSLTATTEAAINLDRKLSKHLANMRALSVRNKYEDYYAVSKEAENVGEKLQLLLRSLPCYTGNPNARAEVEAAILEQVPVEMGYTTQDWFCLRMPLLLPKKEMGSTAYIRGFLFPAMKKFFQGTSPIRFPKSVVVFRYVYDQNRPEREYRDYDNIECNIVMDAIALYLMNDDGPLRCHHYHCSVPGTTERTEVYLIPMGEIVTWFGMEPSLPDEGLVLSRFPPIKAEKDIEKTSKMPVFRKEDIPIF